MLSKVLLVSCLLARISLAFPLIPYTTTTLVQDCIRRCPAEENPSPVCASDGELYPNLCAFNCSQTIIKDLSLVHEDNCKTMIGDDKHFKQKIIIKRNAPEDNEEMIKFIEYIIQNPDRRKLLLSDEDQTIPNRFEYAADYEPIEWRTNPSKSNSFVPENIWRSLYALRKANRQLMLARNARRSVINELDSIAMSLKNQIGGNESPGVMSFGNDGIHADVEQTSDGPKSARDMSRQTKELFDSHDVDDFVAPNDHWRMIHENRLPQENNDNTKDDISDTESETEASDRPVEQSDFSYGFHKSLKEGILSRRGNINDAEFAEEPETSHLDEITTASLSDLSTNIDDENLTKDAESDSVTQNQVKEELRSKPTESNGMSGSDTGNNEFTSEDENDSRIKDINDDTFDKDQTMEEDDSDHSTESFEHSIKKSVDLKNEELEKDHEAQSGSFTTSNEEKTIPIDKTEDHAKSNDSISVTNKNKSHTDDTTNTNEENDDFNSSNNIESEIAEKSDDDVSKNSEMNDESTSDGEDIPDVTSTILEEPSTGDVFENENRESNDSEITSTPNFIDVNLRKDQSNLPDNDESEVSKKSSFHDSRVNDAEARDMNDESSSDATQNNELTTVNNKEENTFGLLKNTENNEEENTSDLSKNKYESFLSDPEAINVSINNKEEDVHSKNTISKETEIPDGSKEESISVDTDDKEKEDDAANTALATASEVDVDEDAISNNPSSSDDIVTKEELVINNDSVNGASNDDAILNIEEVPSLDNVKVLSSKELFKDGNIPLNSIEIPNPVPIDEDFESESDSSYVRRHATPVDDIFEGDDSINSPDNVELANPEENEYQ